MDNLKGIGIVLVVFGHFLIDYVEQGAASQTVKTSFYFIYSFHMPLFIFISGFFSKNVSRIREQAFSRLLLPYLIFNFSMVAFLWLTGERELSLFTPTYVYWFLLALFVWRVFLTDLTAIRFILPVSIAAGLFLGYSPEATNFLAISRIVVFFPFFLLGYYSTPQTIEKIRAAGKLFAFFLIGMAAFLIIFLIKKQWINLGMFLAEPYPEGAENFSLVLRLLFYFVAGLTGTGIMILCPDRKLSLLTRMGKNSLVIYLLHRYAAFAFTEIIPTAHWQNYYFIPLFGISLAVTAFLSIEMLTDVYNRVFDLLGRLIIGKKKVGIFKVQGRQIRIINIGLFLLAPLLWIYLSGGGEKYGNTEVTIHPILDKSYEEKLRSSVNISFVGDLILLENQVKLGLDNEAGEYDFSPVFQYSKKYLAGADLSIGVLEIPLAGEVAGYSTSNYGDGIPLVLNGPDQWARDIKDAGISLVTTANNHAMDKGEAGLLNTIDVLKKTGLDHVGTYASPRARQRIFLKEVRGLKVAVLAYTYGINYHVDELVKKEKSHMVGVLASPGAKGFGRSRDILLEDINRAKALAPDLIIALPHTGKQFSHDKDEFVNAWAKIMFEHGVDIVFGAGSHAVQPLEFKKVTTLSGKKKTVALVYSPGNFVNSYHEFDGDAAAIASIHISDKGPDQGRILGASVIPISIQCKAAGLCRALPVFDVVKDKELKTSLGGLEIKRIKQVQKLVTKVMIGHEISLDQAQDRYYLIPGKGYMRQAYDAADENLPVDTEALDNDRKRLLEKLFIAKKTVVIGDSISVGSRNGGYPWFEPIMHFFMDNRFINRSEDSATSLSLLRKMDHIPPPSADLFIIALGVNDVRYRDKRICALTPRQYIDTLDRMAKKIKKHNPSGSIAFIGPWPAYDNDIFSKLDPEARDRMIEEYNLALKEYCINTGDIYIDANSPIRRYMKTRITDDYIVDHIHPNAGSGLELYGYAVVFGENSL